MTIRIAIAALAVLAGANARAGETPWQEVAPGVSIRMISTGTFSADDKAMLALEIDMPETTKTYWRIPGQTGLPISLDVSASSGISAHRILWPYPQRETKSGKLDYVYYGPTILPLEVTGSADATLDLKATLGICSEICIPAQVHLSLPLTDSAPDSPNQLRIRQALAEVPIGWTQGADPVGTVEAMADGKAVSVEVDAALLDPDSVIVATDGDGLVFGAPQKSPQSNLVVLPILGKSDNSALDGLDVEVTFMTDTGAYVVNRAVEAGTSVKAEAASH
jgi:DsbC/DsbD-like thiol-disulfide interchange protein